MHHVFSAWIRQQHAGDVSAGQAMELQVWYTTLTVCVVGTLNAICSGLVGR